MTEVSFAAHQNPPVVVITSMTHLHGGFIMHRANGLAAVQQPTISAARQRLLEMMRAVNFGRIEHLHVLNGEPQFSPAPCVTRTRKIAGLQNQQLPFRTTDPAFTEAWRNLEAELNALGTGVIRRIELARGIPLFIELSDSQR